MVSHFDPRTGADRSVAYARVTQTVSQSGLKSSRPKTLQCYDPESILTDLLSHG